MTQRNDEVQLLEHGRETDRSHFGRHAERVLLHASVSNSAMLSYTIPKAPAIGELRMAIWVMSSRPGVRLAARVTLPRTSNPATAAPYQITVQGTDTTEVGVWQQLTLDQLPGRLARQARVARLQYNDPLDERGAYVRELLLIVPGGSRQVELLVDRVEVEGVLQPAQDDSTIRQVLASSKLADERDPSEFADNPAIVDNPVITDNQVQPVRSVLPSTQRNAPRVPRIIQWQGEPFDYLARLDFDAIAMRRPASLQEMAEARSLGLFLVCPPPTPDEIRAGKITQDFLPVMTWDLGPLATLQDLHTATLVKGLLTKYDPDTERRSITRPNRYVHEASRIAEILLLGRDTLGAGPTLGDYATWLIGRKRLSRPGTPIWLQLDTELPPGASAQQTQLAISGARATVASPQQLANQVALATTLKSQGFYFTSHTSLNSKNLNTRRRALALELTNLRIGLIQPWLASGKLLTAARSNDPQLTAAVLQVERSYLLVPIRWKRSTNPSQGRRRGPEKQTTFLVPGVPESCEVYFLTPAGASTLRHRRVTGGIRIFFDSQVPDGFVLFTEDVRAFSRAARYIQRHSFRTTRRTRDLASVRLQLALPWASTNSAPGASLVQPLIRSTQGLIEQCDALLAQRNIEVAYQRAVAANTMLDELEIAFGPTLSSPLHLNASVPAKARTTRLMETNFENLAELQQTGWRHQRLPTEGLTSTVRLSPETPYQGSYCMELEVQSTDPAPPVVVTSPVWVTSAPVRVQAGKKVEIRGMVRVPQRITGSIDGLQIFDSLGGMPLAVRFQQTGSWQPFRMVRVAPADTELTITFALTGLGKAQIDHVTIRELSESHLQATREPSQGLSPAR